MAAHGDEDCPMTSDLRCKLSYSSRQTVVRLSLGQVPVLLGPRTLMNFRQYYEGAPHSRQGYGFSARTAEPEAGAQTNRLRGHKRQGYGFQDGKIMGFVTNWW